MPPSSLKETTSDPEKQSAHEVHDLDDGDENVPIVSFWTRALTLSATLEHKIGIEARGIQRVPDDESVRTDHPSGNLFMSVFLSYSPSHT
jgi:hypothetical protein